MPKDPFSLFEYFGQEANARLTLAYPSASEAERFVMFRKELRLNRKTPGYWCAVLGRDSIHGRCIGGCTQIFDGAVGDYHVWQHFSKDDPKEQSRHEISASSQTPARSTRKLVSFRIARIPRKLRRKCGSTPAPTFLAAVVVP